MSSLPQSLSLSHYIRRCVSALSLSPSAASTSSIPSSSSPAISNGSPYITSKHTSNTLNSFTTSSLSSQNPSTSFPAFRWSLKILTYPFLTLCAQTQLDRAGTSSSGSQAAPAKKSKRKKRRNATSSSPGSATSGNENSIIQQLLANPTLYNPLRAPRHPIVLCHGLYGFDTIGPSVLPQLRIHYWGDVLNILRKTVGAEVIVTSVPGTGSIRSRAERMHAFLKDRVDASASGSGGTATQVTVPPQFNFLAHSMGGLDCRHLITHVQPKEYVPMSLTTISTPHRGSAFMDWCKANIGVGALREAMTAASNQDYHMSSDGHPTSSASAPTLPYSLRAPLLARASSSSSSATSQTQAESTLSTLTSYLPALMTLPSSLTTLLLTLLDSPAYSNLTTSYLNTQFNPNTPDRPDVRYFSVAGRKDEIGVFHPLWLPKVILDECERVAWDQPSQSTSSSLASKQDSVENFKGNDGLVTIPSAKWGEFLGVVEDADHWAIRGAAGVGGAWEKGGQGGQWGWGDFWNWRAGGGDSSSASVESVEAETNGDGKVQAVASGSEKTLSEAMDWIVDRLPLEREKQPSQEAAVGDMSRAAKSEEARLEEEEAAGFDLERFYVAISRKLYDEGL